MDILWIYTGTMETYKWPFFLVCPYVIILRPFPEFNCAIQVWVEFKECK
jgi:hypothetical protein